MSPPSAPLGLDRMPSALPLFPLSGARQLPLNIFEPRYLAMIDDALKTHRMIGMIQPDLAGNEEQKVPSLCAVGCAGRITQYAETDDGRYIVMLTGVARFTMAEEIAAVTPYRQGRIEFSRFASDFQPRIGEERVDRGGVLKALREFAEARNLQIDWDSINEAPNEALVNALSEPDDLTGRAEVLAAITESEVARGQNAPSALQ